MHSCAVFSLACDLWKYGHTLVQYPAILPSQPSNNIIYILCILWVYILFDGWEGNMAGYCTSVWPYFHEPQASEIHHKKFLASTIEYELTGHCNSILRGFCRSDCKGLTEYIKVGFSHLYTCSYNVSTNKGVFTNVSPLLFNAYLAV